MPALPDSSPAIPLTTWMCRPTTDALSDFAVISWPELVDGWIDPIRNVGMERDSLDNAAHAWLAELGRHARLAVVDVVLDDARAAADLLGYVVEPAIRRGIELVIGADREFPQHGDDAFLEKHYGYNYSLERLRWQLFGDPSPVERPPTSPDTGFVPAPGAQADAVHAGGGVVQIIAPAGSGKTSVLIERVRELRRRGAPAQSIICLTFNRAARVELDEPRNSPSTDMLVRASAAVTVWGYSSLSSEW